MPRKGHPSKLSARTRRRLVGEVNGRPTITLRRPPRSLAQSRVKVIERTILRSLHKHWLGWEKGTNRAVTEIERTGSVPINRAHDSEAIRM